MKTVGVLRFLGTNCDADVFEAAEAVGLKAQWLWYQDQFNVSDYEALLLPGGFSYGDYLRSGAMAARMPVMKSVAEAAAKGVPVMGICNGFQILCETGLLPGALIKNEKQRFIDKWIELEPANTSSFFASGIKNSIELPVAHGDGCYFAPEDQMKEIQDNDQIWWRYKSNINGSLDRIAGVMNKKKNVAGLMPHPERAMHAWQNQRQAKADGYNFFESLLS